METKLLKNIFWLALVIATLHILAVSFHIYWSYPWFDLPMHFLGGFLVSLIILWMTLKSGRNSLLRSKNNTVVFLIVCTFIVGVLWEIFEVTVGATSLSDGIRYWYDTSYDLMMDYVGALFAAMYGYGIWQKNLQDIVQ